MSLAPTNPGLLGSSWNERVSRELGPTQKVRFRDGIVGCATPDGKYVITSPNMDYIPRPPIGYLTVTMKADTKFGMEDPMVWPQVYCPEKSVCWLSCMRRYKNAYEEEERWHSLTPNDFEPIEKNITRQLGIVKREFRYGFRERILSVAQEIILLEQKGYDVTQARWLSVAMTDAYDRLSLPSTFRDLLRQYICVRRNYAMASAWLWWHKVWEDRLPLDEQHPVRDFLMGAFTTDPNVVQKFFRVGIPVWWMRLEPLLSKEDCILKFVDYTEPPDSVTRSGGYTTMPVYTGPAGLAHLRAVCWRGHLYLDVEPIAVPSSSGTAGEVATSEAVGEEKGTRSRRGPSASKKPKKDNDRATPYQSPPQRHDPDRPGRSKFAAFEHPLMPSACPAWAEALRHVDHFSKQVVEMGYWMPDAALVIGSGIEDRRERYVLNWLRVREAWYYTVRQTRLRRILPVRQWRAYLNHGPLWLTDKHLGKKNGDAAQNVMTFFEEVFNDQGISLSESEPTWNGQVVTTVTPQLCKEVAWELSETGFRTELLFLEQKFTKPDDENIYQRVDWLNQVFPAGTALRLEKLPERNVGLAADDIYERATALEALRCLMCTWPSCPSEIRNSTSLETAKSRSHIELMEKVIARFYTQTFFDVCGRAAIIPHRVPLV